MVCILCMPLFTACDNGVGAELRSVRFTQDVYEADVGSAFKLTYKTYPSSASNYRVAFEFDVPNLMYGFDENGMFTILDENCKQINAKVTYGAGENDFDTCIIKQKEYPVNIYFDKTNDIINKDGTYNLCLYAKMADGSIKTIDRSKYDIELTSSAPNVVSVSEHGMVAVSTGTSGTAKIEARIKKINGSYLGTSLEHPTGYIATTTLEVVEPVEYAVVAIDAFDKFIKTTNDHKQTVQNTYKTTLNQIRLKVLLYSKDDICINNSQIKLDVICSNSFAQIEKNQDGSYKMTDGYYVINLAQEGNAYIEIISNATDENGNPKKFVFYITKEAAGA